MEKCTFNESLPMPDARDIPLPSIEVLQQLTPDELPSKELLGRPMPEPLSVQQLATPAVSPPALAEKPKKEYPFLHFQELPSRNENRTMLPLPILGPTIMPPSAEVSIPDAVLQKAISIDNKGPLSFRNSRASYWPDMSVFRYAEPAEWVKTAEHDFQLLEPPCTNETTFPTSNLRHGVADKRFSALPLLMPHWGIWGPTDGDDWKKRREVIWKRFERNERIGKLPPLRMDEVERCKALYQ